MQISRLFYIAGGFSVGSFNLWPNMAAPFVVGAIILAIGVMFDNNEL